MNKLQNLHQYIAHKTIITINVIQSSSISLYICSPSHTRKHRHTNTSSTINSSITMLCMLLFRFSFLSYRHQPSLVHPSGIYPRDCCLTLWHQPHSMASILYEPSTSFYGSTLYEASTSLFNIMASTSFYGVNSL
jgi:hypothetical protein